MFDNPEKLFIILLIALFIFGPQKLIGLGGAMGKAIREFRGHVRDAQEQFHAAVAEAQHEAEKTEDAFMPSEPAALPAPEPATPIVPALSDPAAAAEPAAATSRADGEDAPSAPAASGFTSPPEPAVEDEGPHSLASEPSSQAVLESLQRRA